MSAEQLRVCIFQIVHTICHILYYTAEATDNMLVSVTGCTFGKGFKCLCTRKKWNL